jgi:hemoglobin-like flavoprotein
MISMSLNQCEDQDKFKKSMIDLAERHCERGVKAVEYGIIGDVLFYSLEATAGGLYSPAVEACWKKVFSSMLAIIVPLCIRYERKGKLKIPQNERQQKKHLLAINRMKTILMLVSFHFISHFSIPQMSSVVNYHPFMY